MKLKTLKDLREKDRDGYPTEMIWEGDLKAEAIKWVKYMANIKDIDKLYTTNYNDIFQWIKHFFNLTEEELKGGESK